MKKSLKIGLGILSLAFISSATIGAIVSCSNNESSVETNNNSANSTSNTLYEQNAKIISSLLPAILPKTIYFSNNDDWTAISILSTPNSIQQLESSIKSNLIEVMNRYVSNPNNSPNPTILTVSGTNYTASELVANLNINFPNVISLEKSYSYNGTTLNNVTFSYDNCPINFACTISGFTSPLNYFINNNLPSVLQNVSLSNWNETIVQSLDNKTILSSAIVDNIQQQLNNNVSKLVINNISLTPEEVMNGLKITIPNTVNYSNGELQKFYVSISALNSNSALELNVTGFKPFTFTNTIWQDVSTKLQSIIDSASGDRIYLQNYNYSVEETLSSQYNSEFSQAVINDLENLNMPSNFVTNNISFNTLSIIQNAKYLLPKNLTQSEISSDEDSNSINGVVLEFNNISVTLPTIYVNSYYNNYPYSSSYIAHSVRVQNIKNNAN